MRRIVLPASFLVLTAALCFVWSRRFERVPGLPTWNLAVLKQVAPPEGVDWEGTEEEPQVKLRRPPDASPASVRLAIPGIPAVEALHVRIRMVGRNLQPGKEHWEDGRAIIEWHKPGHSDDPETVGLGSIRYDERGPLETFVVCTSPERAIPTLRVENLGKSGGLLIPTLELTAVEETQWWTSGRWLLMAGWLGWGIALIRCQPSVPLLRAALASAVWVLAGLYSAVPGPWKLHRAIYPEFSIGQPSASISAIPSGQVDVPGIAIPSGHPPALGKLPDRGNFMLRIKAGIAAARPVLHALLLFAPTLLMAALCGPRPAVWLAAILALSIELAQLGFGYGFDWGDVIDLLNDAVGIGLAVWFYRKFMPSALRL